MRLLVCGNRDWADRALVAEVLGAIAREHPRVVLIHGGNGKRRNGKAYEGLDEIAHDIGVELGWEIRRCQVSLRNGAGLGRSGAEPANARHREADARTHS